MKNYLPNVDEMKKKNGVGYSRTGQCQCGDIKYRLTSPFIKQIVCHCTECQKLSATSFSITALLEKSAFELIKGKLKVYSRQADSGATVDNYFCGNCGNRIYHQNPNNPQVLRVKPGTLEQTDVIQPTVHVWLQSKQDWVVIPEGVEQYYTQPSL